MRKQVQLTYDTIIKIMIMYIRNARVVHTTVRVHCTKVLSYNVHLALHDELNDISGIKVRCVYYVYSTFVRVV